MTKSQKVVNGIDDLYATTVNLEEILYVTKRMSGHSL